VENLPLPSERRRTKYDIYADIIEVIVRKGLCPLTRISYGANMPVDRAKLMDLYRQMAYLFLKSNKLEFLGHY